MICKTYDIVVVPFPFTDSSEIKKRPAVILSQELFNKSHAQSICAMITSSSHEKRISDIEIECLGDAGLSRPSKIRFKLFTLDNYLILGKIGCLAKTDQDSLKEMMCRVFLLD